MEIGCGGELQLSPLEIGKVAFRVVRGFFDAMSQLKDDGCDQASRHFEEREEAYPRDPPVHRNR
jgi:hypothetical protein